jgi:hypothetical protein
VALVNGLKLALDFEFDLSTKTAAVHRVSRLFDLEFWEPGRMALAIDPAVFNDYSPAPSSSGTMPSRRPAI